ncbi:hypothetical protein AMTR_s00039p00221600 [Amborella trichopoda]|uniref:Uncharacterized protein n=1 Tax=Amborella trichopoda TaxID=13333 RepID=U5CRQ6_AMBTC|nr:hypothetical protein AMTR_s00039p00221600 [Amborella trichopoda]
MNRALGSVGFKQRYQRDQQYTPEAGRKYAHVASPKASVRHALAISGNSFPTVGKRRPKSFRRPEAAKATTIKITKALRQAERH